MESHMLHHYDWGWDVSGIDKIEGFHVFLHHFLSKAASDHFAHCFLFALRLSGQFCAAVSKPRNVFLPSSKAYNLKINNLIA